MSNGKNVPSSKLQKHHNDARLKFALSCVLKWNLGQKSVFAEEDFSKAIDIT